MSNTLIKATFLYDDREETLEGVEAAKYQANLKHLIDHANLENNNPFNWNKINPEIVWPTEDFDLVSSDPVSNEVESTTSFDLPEEIIKTDNVPEESTESNPPANKTKSASKKK